MIKDLSNYEINQYDLERKLRKYIKTHEICKDDIDKYINLYFTVNGTKTIKMRDYAGNTVTTSIDINNIDSTAPIISNINNNGTTIKAKIKDAQSYVVSYRWTIGANKNNPVYDTGWKSINGVSTYTAT